MADPNPPGNSCEEYRAPWSEDQQFTRRTWLYDPTPPAPTPSPAPVWIEYCGVDETGERASGVCYYHAAGTVYSNAIDLMDFLQAGTPNPPGGNVLKATRGGETTYFPPGSIGGASSRLRITHSDGTSSWYVHIAYQNDPFIVNAATATPGADPTYVPWSSRFAQGDSASTLSDVNEGEGGVDNDPHLHFYVTTNGTPSPQSPSLNVCLSGKNWLDEPGQPTPTTRCESEVYGWDLKQLSADYATPHASNNTGPGYWRPGAPWDYGQTVTATPVPNLAARPLSSAIREYAMESESLGSTYASFQGPCTSNRRWVKSCQFGVDEYWSPIQAYMQNFIDESMVAASVVESPGWAEDSAYRVRGEMWKAYGWNCGDSYVTVAEIIGRPIGEREIVGQDQYTQEFENGRMESEWGGWSTGWIANAYDSYDNLVCERTVWHERAFDCPDLNHDADVDISDFLRVLFNFGQSYPSQAYRDSADVNRDGGIDAADILDLVPWVGTCNYQED